MKIIYTIILLVGLTLNAQTNLTSIELVKLHQAGVSDNVLVTYLNNSVRPIIPSTDDIIYLHHSGISSNIISDYITKSYQKVNAIVVELKKEDKLAESMLTQRRDYFFNRAYPMYPFEIRRNRFGF